MKTIHAIYENGVFRPVDRVELPEGTRVNIVLQTSSTTVAVLESTPAQDAARKRVWVLMSRRFNSGEPTNILETHNDHQP